MNQAIQFTSLEKQLLQLISEKPTPLPELSQILLLEETQIKELLEHFKHLGIAYTITQNDDYFLPCFFDRIDIHQLKQNLNHLKLELFYFDCIDSTNLFLKQAYFKSPITCCLSEMQTQGRGRFGRPWCSPYGLNIYHSMRLSIKLPPNQLKGLSLVVALALCEAIEEMGITTKLEIKWPNDLIIAEQKLAGILIELIELTADACQVIIGTGLNVNSLPQDMPDVEQAWTSLYQLTGTPIAREQLIVRITNKILTFISIYQQTGLKSLKTAWIARDYLFNRTIEVLQGTQPIAGIAQGIDAQGRLILKDKDNQLHFLESGEVSIKK